MEDLTEEMKSKSNDVEMTDEEEEHKKELEE